jgi:hypothetical protein
MHAEGAVLAGIELPTTFVLAQTAQSERSTTVAMAMPIRLRLRFIINAYLKTVRLNTQTQLLQLKASHLTLRGKILS